MTASAFSQNNRFLLNDCADLTLGYSYRGRIEGSDEGTVRLIQMRDLSSDNLVDPSKAIKTIDPGFSPNHYIESGDLIFRARGMNNTVAYASENIGVAALAAPLIRVRMKRGDIDPRFVQWFINLPSSQSFMVSGLQGSLVRMVSIEHLARLELIVPPLATQRVIVELAALYAREVELLEKLAIIRGRHGQAIIAQRLLGIDRRKYGD